MQRTGLAILALVIALLTSSGLAAPCRAQTPGPSRAQAAAQSNMTQAAPAAATKSPATKLTVSPNIFSHVPATTSPAPAQTAPSDTPPAASRMATVPDFMGRTRSDASALAQSYHLVPEFVGAADNGATVTDQAPSAGAPLSQANGSVRLAMKAQEKAQKAPSQGGSKFSDFVSDFANALSQSKKPVPMPDFVGRTRNQAIALAQEKGIKWIFYGATSDDAKVASQFPTAGTPINAAAASVRLQMAAPEPQPQHVPDFVGHTRSEASAMAPQYGLVPAFNGPPSDDALVTRQSLEAGTPIFHVGTQILLQIEAQGPPPTPATPPQTKPAPPQQTEPAPPQQTKPEPPSQTEPAPPPQTKPAPPQHTKPVKPQQRKKTPQRRTTSSCVSRDLISWLMPGQAANLTCPDSKTNNWLTLLAIIAALAAATWALLRKPPPPIPNRTDLRTKGPTPPQHSLTAQLVTQTISTGIAAITASVHAVDARRFDIRYVMEHDARPRAEAIRITISGDGGDDGRSA